MPLRASCCTDFVQAGTNCLWRIVSHCLSFSKIDVTELIRKTYSVFLDFRDNMGMLHRASTEITTDNAFIIVTPIDPGNKHLCVGYLGNSAVAISERGGLGVDRW
jgi:hypothetical protein